MIFMYLSRSLFLCVSPLPCLCCLTLVGGRRQSPWEMLVAPALWERRGRPPDEPIALSTNAAYVGWFSLLFRPVCCADQAARLQVVAVLYCRPRPVASHYLHKVATYNTVRSKVAYSRGLSPYVQHRSSLIGESSMRYQSCEGWPDRMRYDIYF